MNYLIRYMLRVYCNQIHLPIHRYLFYPEIKFCENNPCKNGNCSEGFGTYICHCVAGYTGQDCETGRSLSVGIINTYPGLIMKDYE